MPRRPDDGPPLDFAWWEREPAAILAALASSPGGLTAAAAAVRRARYGQNLPRDAGRLRPWLQLARQLTSPLVLILVLAAALAAALGERVDAAVITFIVGGSALLSFLREAAAERTIERLRQSLVTRAQVLRDGAVAALPAAEVVPGDVVLLAAGTLVPADGLLLESTDLFVSQASLTGETFPAEKAVGPAAPGAGLAERRGAVFQGSSVRSGLGRMVVAATGRHTAYGRIAADLREQAPETDFERGIRRFGYLLARLMLVLVLLVFAANVAADKPAIDSLLFAMALAVGISPELLPAIVAVNLSRGARWMAARGVIVRRLSAIESLGCMDVLCVDKTGTLTSGVLRLEAAVDPTGAPSPAVRRDAYWNAALESGLPNPLDEALRAAGSDMREEPAAVKLGEVPYDFVRRRLSVAIAAGDGGRLITKGAFHEVLAICTRIAAGGEEAELDPPRRAALAARYAAWGEQGLRVLALAGRRLAAGERVAREAEAGMTFGGFLLFADPPKPGVATAVATLARFGVELKMLTGDNRQVARHVAEAVGLPERSLLTGEELDAIPNDALPRRVAGVGIFAELDPNQKERVLGALKAAGRVVGFLGDGINDAPSLHAADVGISVDQAADVAKEAASLVLLAPDLEVLGHGIEEGRKTFVNTLKYLFTTSSANFGNMVSMAIASVGLPFLPLLAKQILLNNFLSDLPALAIAGDGVDPEQLARPRRWDLRFIRDFMVVFGLLSSFFDLVVFGYLLWVLKATPELFQSAWFVVSLLTEVAVVFVLRTRRPFLRSRPGGLLAAASAAVAALALLLPYLPAPAARLLGLVPVPPPAMALLLGLTLLYVAASEAVKQGFYRRFERGGRTF